MAPRKQRSGGDVAVIKPDVEAETLQSVDLTPDVDTNSEVPGQEADQPEAERIIKSLQTQILNTEDRVDEVIEEREHLRRIVRRIKPTLARYWNAIPHGARLLKEVEQVLKAD